MRLIPAWPLLALALCACAKQERPQPIPAVARQRICPAFPAPPPALLRPPVKTDFLIRTR